MERGRGAPCHTILECNRALAETTLMRVARRHRADEK